jgi:hypothetical protein
VKKKSRFYAFIFSLLVNISYPVHGQEIPPGIDMKGIPPGLLDAIKSSSGSSYKLHIETIKLDECTIPPEQPKKSISDSCDYVIKLYKEKDRSVCDAVKGTKAVKNLKLAKYKQPIRAEIVKRGIPPHEYAVDFYQDERSTIDFPIWDCGKLSREDDYILMSIAVALLLHENGHIIAFPRDPVSKKLSISTTFGFPVGGFPPSSYEKAKKLAEDVVNDVTVDFPKKYDTLSNHGQTQSAVNGEKFEGKRLTLFYLGGPNIDIAEIRKEYRLKNRIAPDIKLPPKKTPDIILPK